MQAVTTIVSNVAQGRVERSMFWQKSLVPWHMVLGWLKLSGVVVFLIDTRGPAAAIVVAEDIEEQGLTTRQHQQEDETSDED
jgi:hypothetical protein